MRDGVDVMMYVRVFRNLKKDLNQIANRKRYEKFMDDEKRLKLIIVWHEIIIINSVDD